MSSFNGPIPIEVNGDYEQVAVVSNNLKFGTRLIFATVRIFTAIFAFYILLLSAVPCCALENCVDEMQQTQQKSQQHEHNDGCKSCSPFNQCANCVGFTCSSRSIQINTPQQLSQRIFSFYSQPYIPEYISNFWQPPKLS